MNNLKETTEEIWLQIKKMPLQEKGELLFELNAGNLAKQQYIDGLESQLSKIQGERDVAHERITDIENWARSLCEQKCKGRENYTGRLRHETDCPIWNLDIKQVDSIANA